MFSARDFLSDVKLTKGLDLPTAVFGGGIFNDLINELLTPRFATGMVHWKGSSMVHLPDLPLFQRAAGILCGFSQRSRIRAAAQTGTAQVLRWQSSTLCEASARAVMEAAHLVARSRRSRNAGGDTKASFDLRQRRLTAARPGCEPPRRETEKLNLVDLAQVLADIASRTRDANAVRELMVLVNQLFTAAGLPALSPDPPVRH